MSEETQETQNDGTWSGLKKTIIGTLTTVIGGGGIWLSTQLFGGHSDEESDAKTEQVVQPAAAPVINVNLENNNTNQQKQQGGTTVIREKVVEKPASQAAPAKPKEEEDPW
jgi:flagellar basal body-associated protein FliL